MAPQSPSPAELRDVFGRNLRLLVNDYPSVSEVSRRLNINRTQLNRYLQGDSFPRPDILHRICEFFDVDARVLLEPIEKLRPQPAPKAELRDFLTFERGNLSEADFPSGFYHFSRRSFLNEEFFIQGLVYVYRKGSEVIVRGYEPKSAMKRQGMASTPDRREFRGHAASAEGGVAFVVSRRSATTCSFNYLNRVPSYDGNLWVGYVSRTIPEQITGPRVTRLVYEHIGEDRDRIFALARTTDFSTDQDLQPFHRRLLQIYVPFR